MRQQKHLLPPQSIDKKKAGEIIKLLIHAIESDITEARSLLSNLKTIAGDTLDIGHIESAIASFDGDQALFEIQKLAEKFDLSLIIDSSD